MSDRSHLCDNLQAPVSPPRHVATVIVGAAVLLAGTGGAVAASPRASLEMSELCAGRDPCSLVSTHDAGSRNGRPLRVAELELGADDLCENPDSHPGFDHREFWLLAVSPTDQPTMVLKICNNGYGAAGMGADSVQIADNRIHHTQSGGSAWRWVTTRASSLAPFRVLREKSSFFHTMGPDFSADLIDWSRLEGVRIEGQVPSDYPEIWYRPGELRYYIGFMGVEDDAIPLTDLPWPTDAPTNGAKSRLTAYQYVMALPSNSFEAATGTPLGTCSSAIGEDLRPGFLIHGSGAERGAKGGAIMRYLVRGDRELVLTVLDDRFEGGGESWVHDDHVEIWVESPTGKLAQWGVGLDGSVYPAYGAPPRLDLIAFRVDEESGRRRATLYLRLPWPIDEITLVYSKARDRRQFRLVATSVFRFGDASRLGRALKVEDKRVRCLERKGRVDLVSFE